MPELLQIFVHVCVARLRYVMHFRFYGRIILEVFLNDMRYINPRFTYLLTYLYLHIMDRTGHIDRVTSLRHRAQVIAPLLRRIGCGYLAVVCHVLDDGVRHCANDAGRWGRSLHWRRNRPRRSKTRYSTVGPTIARSPV